MQAKIFDETDIAVVGKGAAIAWLIALPPCSAVLDVSSSKGHPWQDMAAAKAWPSLNLLFKSVRAGFLLYAAPMYANMTAGQHKTEQHEDLLMVLCSPQGTHAYRGCGSMSVRYLNHGAPCLLCICCLPYMHHVHWSCTCR